MIVISLQLLQFFYIPMSSFNKGILYIILGSFWWGVIGVIYFRSVSFVGSIELVLHRVIWTALILVITTFYLSKWSQLIKILKNRKNVFYLETFS